MKVTVPRSRGALYPQSDCADCCASVAVSGWSGDGGCLLVDPRLNRSRGARLIRAFVLCHELSAYLAEHEASGVHLDTECQEVRYVDGVYLLLRRSQGIWYITDVFAAEEGDDYEPMYFWQRVRRGAGSGS